MRKNTAKCSLTLVLILVLTLAAVFGAVFGNERLNVVRGRENAPGTRDE